MGSAAQSVPATLEPDASSVFVHLERIRPGELSDIDLVRDQSSFRAPVVQQEGGWLEVEGRRSVRPEVERHLVRDARRYLRQATAEARDDRSVCMAAEDALDLRVTADHRLESTG